MNDVWSALTRKAIFGGYTKVSSGNYQVLIWFCRLLRYQGHAIWAAPPIPPTPQPLSQRSNPKCIPLLGFFFSHVPYWHKTDILIGADGCPLLGVKRTSAERCRMSA